MLLAGVQTKVAWGITETVTYEEWPQCFAHNWFKSNWLFCQESDFVDFQTASRIASNLEAPWKILSDHWILIWGRDFVGRPLWHVVQLVREGCTCVEEYSGFKIDCTPLHNGVHYSSGCLSWMFFLRCLKMIQYNSALTVWPCGKKRSAYFTT